MQIYLIGMMGSGKTTIGRALSTYLDAEFIDLDTFIETREQMSISDMFERYGEAYFRKKETAALHDVQQFKNAIIATGGGIVSETENCELLKQACTIFLNGSVDTLWERVKDDLSRPLVTGKEQFKARYNKRIEAYVQTATYTVVIENKTVKDIVSEILFIIAQKKG